MVVTLTTGLSEQNMLTECVDMCVCQCMCEPHDGNSSRIRVVGLQGTLFLFVYGYNLIFDNVM